MRGIFPRGQGPSFRGDTREIVRKRGAPDVPRATSVGTIGAATSKPGYARILVFKLYAFVLSERDADAINWRSQPPKIARRAICHRVIRLHILSALDLKLQTAAGLREDVTHAAAEAPVTDQYLKRPDTGDAVLAMRGLLDREQNLRSRRTHI